MFLSFYPKKPKKYWKGRFQFTCELHKPYNHTKSTSSCFSKIYRTIENYTHHITHLRKSIIKTKDPNFEAAETKLRRRLGTNVSIIPNAKGTGGKLEIEYYNQQDLDRIYQTIIE